MWAYFAAVVYTAGFAPVATGAATPNTAKTISPITAEKIPLQ